MAEQTKLSKHLLELLSESLGLSPSYLIDFFGEEYSQIFLVNHYTPNPGSTPTEGIQKHSDFSALTILDGRWRWLLLLLNAFIFTPLTWLLYHWHVQSLECRHILSCLGVGSIAFLIYQNRVLSQRMCSQVLFRIPKLGQFGQITLPLGVNLCIITRLR